MLVVESTPYGDERADRDEIGTARQSTISARKETG